MGTAFFKPRWEAFNEAVGVRRLALAPVAGAAASFVDWVSTRLAEAGMGHLIGVPSWAIGVFVALIVIAYWLLDYIVRLRTRLTPALLVDYDDKAQDCHKTIEISPGKGKPHHFGRSLRLRVTCASDENVEHCSGFLTKIEYRVDGGQFSDLPLYEPTYLDWSLQDPPFSPVTVFPRVPRYLAMCRTDENVAGFFIRTKHRSFVTPESFDKIGEYKIHVEIVAARAPTLSRALLITWNGRWNEIRAHLVENN